MTAATKLETLAPDPFMRRMDEAVRRAARGAQLAAKLAGKRPVVRTNMDAIGDRAIGAADRTVAIEESGLKALRETMTGPMAAAFIEAVDIILSAPGRVVVTGIGKSGHVGQKIAATLASTGTPAFFVHPTEASHGDLGMITRSDVVLCLSWSGETVELGNIINFSRRFAVPMIAITSRATSTLGKQSDVVLELPRADEACPHGLAPTTSTTMQLALGDCLAIALLESRGFTATDFKDFHPGGSLGASLRFVSDLMHAGDRMPLAREDVSMGEALVTMTSKAFGCLGIVNAEGELVGVVTDGDLRRHMGKNLIDQTTGKVMTKRPKTVAPGVLASAALELLNTTRITALFVVEDRKPVGIIHIHDLLRAGVA